MHPTRKRMPYEVTVWTRYGLLFGAQGMVPVQKVAEMIKEHGLSYFGNSPSEKSAAPADARRLLDLTG